MNVAASSLADIASHALTEDGQMLRTVINSTSTTEAGFAVGLLREVMPRRSIVAALNLREIVRELPEAPFLLPADFEALARIADLERRGSSWVKRLGDGDLAPEIELLGQGNLCYDVVIRAGDESALLKPGPVKDDFVTPVALELLLENEGLLRGVVDLINEIGLVHNPRFYMTLEDWQMEHAAESMQGLADLF